MTYLAPAVIERLILHRHIPAVKIVDLIEVVEKPWQEQEVVVFEDPR